MRYPKIEIYTEDKANFEAQYICFLAKSISMGFYERGNYFILPKLYKGSANTVHFPNLGYSKEFWRAINFSSNVNLLTAFPKEAVTEAEKLLSKKRNKEALIICEELSKEWRKIEKQFFKDVSGFLNLDDILDKVEKIKILITPYGSVGSFNPPRVGNKFNLMVTSRMDMPVGNIAAGILQNLYIIKTRIGGEIGSENYLKRMSTINFIFKHTKFAKYYPEFPDLITPSASFPSELHNKSAKYLEKLGFPQKEIKFDFDGGCFTKQESMLLKSLIKNRGKIVSFDRTANILWGKDSDEKFSLEAMAKVVENIRRKIRESGIQRNILGTIRSRGYIWLN